MISESEFPTLLKESPHILATFHLPKNRDFKDLGSFKETIGSLTIRDFVNDPLPLDNNLNFQDIMRFVSFRIWCAKTKFPDLLDGLVRMYEKTIPEFLKNEEIKSEISKEELILKKSLLWHKSRLFLEDDIELVQWNISEFQWSICVGIDEYELNSEIKKEFQAYLMKIFDSAAFKEAVKIFATITNIALNPENILKLVEDVKKLNIIPMIATHSLYSMVLPDGIALSFPAIKNLVNPKEQNPKKALISARLWVTIQQIGHFLIRSKVLGNELDFAKVISPCEYKDYKSLDAGFLFSMIFLGTFNKMIWEKPDLISKMTDLDPSNPTIPIYCDEELKDIPIIGHKHLTNFGALVMIGRFYGRIMI